jgi:hypothetical protein
VSAQIVQREVLKEDPDFGPPLVEADDKLLDLLLIDGHTPQQS